MIDRVLITDPSYGYKYWSRVWEIYTHLIIHAHETASQGIVHAAKLVAHFWGLPSFNPQFGVGYLIFGGWG